MTENGTEKKRQGFACLPHEQVTAIASLGGKAAHAKGTAHRFTSQEAREAGRKGGKAMRQRPLKVNGVPIAATPDGGDRTPLE